ncbi:MAG: restriction endonuclease [Holophagales bacterium]|jgi:hypothetical protein|nr:restriction endonuclease [Holophagales bacterium]
MTKNTGRDYEILSGEMIQEIIKFKEGSKIKIHKIEYRVNKFGKSTKHEIDVWIEYIDQHGTTKYYAIQAKNEKNPINKADLLVFAKIIEELGCKGIFITRTGYRNGAKEVAQHYNIPILEFRVPTDDDFISRVRQLNFKYTQQLPFLEDSYLIPVDDNDKDKILLLTEWKIGITKADSFNFRTELFNFLVMLNNTNTLSDLQLRIGLNVQVNRTIHPTEPYLELIYLKFLQPTFLFFNDLKVGLKYVCIKCGWMELPDITLSAENIIHYLIIDVLSGKEYTIGPFGFREREPLSDIPENDMIETVECVHGKGAYNNFLTLHPAKRKAINQAIRKHHHRYSIRCSTRKLWK